jgi:hypothetical protein
MGYEIRPMQDPLDNPQKAKLIALDMKISRRRGQQIYKAEKWMPRKKRTHDKGASLQPMQ